MLTTPRLVIPQPQASLIAHGHKRIITSKHPTAYTGLVYLYNSPHPPTHEDDARIERICDWYGLHLPARNHPNKLVATATLVSCSPTGKPEEYSSLERALDDFNQPYAWLLADAKPVHPRNFITHLSGYLSRKTALPS